MFIKQQKTDLNHKNTLFTLNLIKINSKLSYKFYFVSLLPIYIITNLRGLDWTRPDQSHLKENYILIKQSYLILTWLSYTTLGSSSIKKKNIKFMTMPIRRKKYTITKAPMAHKTNSKEQYGFKFYFFKATFHSYLEPHMSISSVDFGAFFINNLKKLFPIFSTNLLFLKYYNVNFVVSDFNYFNYFNFTSLTIK